MKKLYQKGENFNDSTLEKLSKHYTQIINLIGEDSNRQGLLKSPERISKALLFLTQGYNENPDEVIQSAIFHEKDYKQMVIIKDIELYSLCEHHLLPFIGKAHIAYIPNEKITGLSKIPRVVEIYSRRLQVQERLTTQIKNCIYKNLKPLGVAVVIEARHLCMSMRGIENQNAITTTSDFIGAFERTSTREEFFSLIGRSL